MKKFMVGVFLLAGCTQPVVNPNLPTSQHKISSAVHWDALAERTLDTLVPALHQISSGPSGHTINGQPAQMSLGTRPYYVRPPARDMAFAQAFTPFLQSAILQRGHAVTQEPHNAVVVNYDVQTFYYEGDNRDRSPIDYFSFWTTLATAGYVIGRASPSLGEAAALVFVAGPILDALHASGSVTNAEVLFTVTVTSGSQVLHKQTETFYVEPKDLPFYWSAQRTEPLETHHFSPPALQPRHFTVAH